MTLLAALCGAVVGGTGSVWSPAMVRAVPEPDDENATDAATDKSADQTVTAAVVEEEPKPLYADLGARPGLWWRTALVGAVSGAVIGATQGWSWTLLVLLPLVPVMVALGHIDWNTRLLPTWLIKPAYVAVIALVLVAGIASGDLGAIGRAALGWLVLGGFYFLLWFINSGGLGYGDVRLSGVLGIALGFVGWAELLSGAWCGFLAGGVIGAVLAAAKVVDRKGVPFGPFMLVGVLMGLAAGPWFATVMG
ncbi:prepilin peptidase [Nocardioides yefusunii]|uniref:Prepilin peptidase n=1 Tax=Nocardioides yefusunii TaxID=2500546 RepID=A0ABW1R3P0_9ACTN|nr:A24 family peptidase [Nocardioides yefusunii]